MALAAGDDLSAGVAPLVAGDSAGDDAAVEHDRHVPAVERLLDAVGDPLRPTSWCTVLGEPKQELGDVAPLLRCQGLPSFQLQTHELDMRMLPDTPILDEVRGKRRGKQPDRANPDHHQHGSHQSSEA